MRQLTRAEPRFLASADQSPQSRPSRLEGTVFGPRGGPDQGRSSPAAAEQIEQSWGLTMVAGVEEWVWPKGYGGDKSFVRVA
jgi:hypothetical protein